MEISDYVTIVFTVPESHADSVLDAIKKAHPYEQIVIDIYPIYKAGIKM